MKTNFILLLLSIIFCIVLSEIYLSLYGHNIFHIEDASTQYKFFKYDPILGWVNNPNRYGNLVRPEFVNKISINSLGMRDHEINLESKKNKIAILGDSFSWGIGVNLEERYSELLESYTGIEVLNFGVSGYGPLQNYLILDEIINLKPNLVILQFCLNNDLLDNIFWKRYGYYKPYVIDTNLKIHGMPIPNVREFALDNRFDSYLSKYKIYLLIKNLINNKLNKYLESNKQQGLIGLSDIGYDFYYPDESKNIELIEKSYLINKSILSEISKKLKNNNIKFAVLISPTKCEFGICFNNKTDSNFVVYNNIINTLNQLSIPYIDPLQNFTKDDFWNYDGHWRATGHKKIAESITNWLEKNNL